MSALTNCLFLFLFPSVFTHDLKLNFFWSFYVLVFLSFCFCELLLPTALIILVSRNDIHLKIAEIAWELPGKNCLALVLKLQVNISSAYIYTLVYNWPAIVGCHVLFFSILCFFILFALILSNSSLLSISLCNVSHAFCMDTCMSASL